MKSIESWLLYLQPLSCSEHNGPTIAALEYVKGRVESVSGFMITDTGGCPGDQLRVGLVAIRFALDSLECLGLCDGVDPPMPGTRESALHSLDNILRVINGYIAMAYHIAAEASDEAKPKKEDGSEGCRIAQPLVVCEMLPPSLPAIDKNQIVAAYLQRHPGSSIRFVEEATGIKKTTIGRQPAWRNRSQQIKDDPLSSERTKMHLPYVDSEYKPSNCLPPVDILIEKEDAEMFLAAHGFTAEDIKEAKVDVLTLKAQFEWSWDYLEGTEWDREQLAGMRVIEAAKVYAEQKEDSAQGNRSRTILR